MNRAEQLSIVCAIIYAHNPDVGITTAMNDAVAIVQRAALDGMEEARREDRKLGKAVGEANVVEYE